jgi:hypothetical protein
LKLGVSSGERGSCGLIRCYGLSERVDESRDSCDGSRVDPLLTMEGSQAAILVDAMADASKP